MASLGKSINLYLMDGTASGRWEATLSNWNGVAYKIPRGAVKACSDLPELNTPGVYFLFGKDDESGKQFIYVGEADDTQKRLLQPHTFEKDKSYWTEAVIFVTPDGTLEKGRIKYLENRFYTIAAEANRYIVKNGNTPTKSPMPKQIRDLLEEFIINVQLILPALGYTAFEPLPSSEAEDDTVEDKLLYFSRNKGKGGSAVGRVSSDGFWVLKGSYIYPQVADYAGSGIKKARENHAASIDKNWILQEDICFGSPSYASTFVCGKNSNGLVEWKNKDGISLKNLDSIDFHSAPKKGKPTIQIPQTVETDSNNELLHLGGNKLIATGLLTDDGFIVKKGSDFSPDETNSCPTWVRNIRKQLVEEGKVKDNVFMEDVFFASSSSAASCVTGRSESGNRIWLDSDGQKLKNKRNK